MIHLEERNGGVVDGLTNMFDLEEKKVVFVPQGGNAQYTDPSYHLPAFYKLWAVWADKDKEFWQTTADTSRAFLIRATHLNSGLTTDYMNFDGTPHAETFNPNADKFSSDSYRVAMNIAMDCSWWGYQKWHSDQLDTLLLFLSDFGTAYQSQYEWNGTLLEKNYASTALFAMNGVAPLGATAQQSWDYINKLYSLSVPSGQWRYYDGLLYMLAMLNSSGQYKIWKPGDAITNPAPVPPAEVIVFDPFKEDTYIDITNSTKNSVFSKGAELFITNNDEEVIDAANVVDVNGVLVAQLKSGISANSTVSFTLPNVSAGVYFVTVITKTGSSVSKIVVE